MQIDDLPQHLIFFTVFGSHAYGTSTPESDWDVRGVAIAPLQTYFGTRPWEQFNGCTMYLGSLLLNRYPQAVGPFDCEVFNLTKFVRLAADANPNILDILFAHPDDWLYNTPIWQLLYDQRHIFLSMRVRHTYTGYAMSQLKRIKTHRKWLLEPPKHKPQRADFGLPEHHSLVPRDVQDLANAMISKKQQEWQLDTLLEQIPEAQREELRDQMLQYFEMVHGRPYQPHEEHELEQAAIQCGIPHDLYRRLDAERRYKQAYQHWQQYQEWLQTRNQARSALEQQYGYDTKHASHLVRLLLSVEEILRSGELSVRHPHSHLLREIRKGAWSYDQLMQWASEQEHIIHQLANQKPLPHSPNRNQIDALITQMILQNNKAAVPEIVSN